MGTNKEYFAFISYKSEDAEWAMWLQHELEHYHLPLSFNGRTDVPQELKPIFRDIDELSAGNLPEQIKHALINSQNLIVICSPQAAGSPWVNQEVEAFISLGRTDRIFPFIIDGSTPSEFFPPALLNLPKEEERLGGDVRKKGRDAAFVKVVAGMLGVSFDSLWNRYEKEKAEEERKVREQRDCLLRIQSRFLAEKANSLVNEGDSYTARLLALEALPQKHNSRPYVPEAENALLLSYEYDNAIIRHEEGVAVAKFVCKDRFFLSFTTGDPMKINVVDAKTGQILYCFHRSIKKYHNSFSFFHEENFFFCEADNHIATIESGYINLYDINTFLFKTKLNAPTGKIICVDTQASSRFLCTATEMSLDIWDINKGIIIKSIGIDVKPFFICCNLKKNIIIYISEDGRFFLTDIKQKKHKLIAKNTFYYSAYIASGSDAIVAVSENKITFWDIYGNYIFSINIVCHIDDVCFNPLDDSFAFIQGNDIEIWSIKKRKHLRTLKGHTDLIETIQFSPNGLWLVSASQDNTIILWNSQSGLVLKQFKGHKEGVRSAFFSCDMKKIISASDDFTCRIWDLRMISKYKIANYFFSACKWISSVSYSSDGKRIVIGMGNNKIFLIDNKGCILRTFEGHALPVNHVSFSQNQSEIVSCSEDGTIKLWDVKTGKLRLTLDGHTGGVHDFSYSQDGKYLVSCSADKTLRVWDVLSGMQQTIIELEFSLKCVRLSADSLILIAGAEDNNIYLWDFTSINNHKNPMRVFKGHNDVINSITFSPIQNDIFASASADATIRIWDIKSNDSIKILKGHKNYINSIIFSPDGKRIASASGFEFHDIDNTVKIWDVSSGETILTLCGHEKSVNDVSFSPDGRFLISASDDESIIKWQIPSLQSLIDRTLKNFPSPILSPEERKKYFLD